MIDVNLPLKKAYFAAFAGITYLGVPVKSFYGQLPSTISPAIYIIFRPITDTDNSAKTASLHITLMSVSIFTNSEVYNDGVAVDVVANTVMQRIYPRPNYNITLSNTDLQVVRTYKDSDTTDNFSVDRQNTYIDRTIIFRHNIFENPS